MAPSFRKPGHEHTMPSFDIVSEIELHEVTNAVDQASRRFLVST